MGFQTSYLHTISCYVFISNKRKVIYLHLHIDEGKEKSVGELMDVEFVRCACSLNTAWCLRFTEGGLTRLASSKASTLQEINQSQKSVSRVSTKNSGRLDKYS
jgi:hypothetical protein